MMIGHLFGEIKKNAKIVNGVYFMNKEDAERYIPEFFLMKKEDAINIVEELGKPLSIIYSTHNIDVPTFLREKIKEISESDCVERKFFPEKFLLYELHITKNGIARRATRTLKSKFDFYIDENGTEKCVG